MASAVHRQVPSRLDTVVFEAKAAVFRGLRAWDEALARKATRRHARGDALCDAPVVARVRSPLWNGPAGAKEYALTAGKIQNLRIALAGLDGIVVPAGETFSFWKQVGRATRRRGFVAGRELREGCLVANIGGGLCQLSNALYEAALAAGFEIVERHAHSRRVPGSRAALQRDATVFWNYVDLRFRSCERLPGRGAADEPPPRGGVPGRARRCRPRDGGGGRRAPCRRERLHHLRRDALPSQRPRDRNARAPPDRLASRRRMARVRGASDARGARRKTRCSCRCAGRRGRATPGPPAAAAPRPPHRSSRCNAPSRSAARRRRGAALQSRLLAFDRKLARRYARTLSHLHAHVVVSQNLLPHLWAAGALAGRSFDVLVERWPMTALEARLDGALGAHPESPTLGDFRAPAEVVAAETEALAAAERLYTPHRAIAASFGDRAVLLDWALPAADEADRARRPHDPVPGLGARPQGRLRAARGAQRARCRARRRRRRDRARRRLLGRA